jgi:hypothetical protein
MDKERQLKELHIMKSFKEELEEFWTTFIGDSGKIESGSITQIFVRGPFAGHSIREVMELCISTLNKPRPEITQSENYN